MSVFVIELYFFVRAQGWDGKLSHQQSCSEGTLYMIQLAEAHLWVNLQLDVLQHLEGSRPRALI